MNPHSNPKNILILGGNPETAALVEVGNAMGLTTCVVDPYPGSPAKRPAAKSYDVDVKDFAAIDRIVRDEHIDGILVGVADPLVPFYQQLCQRYGFPCYATEKVIRALASKASFAQTCSEYGITITPNYPIDLVLLTHAHYDHFHKPTLRKLPATKIGIMPWGVGDLAKKLGFARIVELDWWESFSQGDWKVTFTPSKHWGARTLHDHHRGYGGFVLEHQGRKIYHAGDSAYFEGFAEIGEKLRPEIALLPIGAYHPESFRKVHMGPDEAVQAFKDLRAKVLVPMHYGTFKLSFEDMAEPPRWLKEIAAQQKLSSRLKILDEGVPKVF